MDVQDTAIQSARAHALLDVLLIWVLHDVVRPQVPERQHLPQHVLFRVRRDRRKDLHASGAQVNFTEARVFHLIRHVLDRHRLSRDFEPEGSLDTLDAVVGEIRLELGVCRLVPRHRASLSDYTHVDSDGYLQFTCPRGHDHVPTSHRSAQPAELSNPCSHRQRRLPRVTVPSSAQPGGQTRSREVILDLIQNKVAYWVSV